MSFVRLNCCLCEAIIAQVDHAIGVEGIISMECNDLVSQYRGMILNLLIGQVCHFLYFLSLVQISIHGRVSCEMILLGIIPKL